MKRVRSHLTYANVVATLALVTAIGGGAAYAADTIFSTDIVDDQVFSADVRNDGLSGGGLAAADLRAGAVGSSEVLDDTASGGGLTAPDLRAGSVATSEVLNNSLTGDDINEQSLTGNTRKLLYAANAASPASQSTLAAVGPYTLKASCEDFGSGVVQFRLYARGSAGTARFSYHESLYGSPSGNDRFSFDTVPILANTTTVIAQTTPVQDHPVGLAGTVMINSGSTIVQVDFNGEAYSSYGQVSHCLVYGTATKAT